MPIATELTYRTNAGPWQAATNRINELEAHLTECDRTIAQHVTEETELRTAAGELESMRLAIHVSERATAIIEQGARTARNSADRALNYANDWRRAREDYASRLPQARLQLATVKPPTEVTLTQAIAEAALAPVEAKYVRLYTDPEGNKQVRFTLYGLKMHAMRNARPWFNAAQNGTIALPPVHIVFDVETGALRMLPTHKYFAHSPSGMTDRPQAHPHVLTCYSACWGDFMAPIAEATATGDLTTIATIVKLFLSQADMNDTAGKHAWKWAIPELTHDPQALVAHASGRALQWDNKPLQTFVTADGSVLRCYRTDGGFPPDEAFTPERLYTPPQGDLDIAEEDRMIDHRLNGDHETPGNPLDLPELADLRTGPATWMASTPPRAPAEQRAEEEEVW